MKKTLKKANKLITMLAVVFILVLSLSVTVGAIHSDGMCKNGWMMVTKWDVVLCDGFDDYEGYGSYTYVHGVDETVVSPTVFVYGDGSVEPVAWVYILHEETGNIVKHATIPYTSNGCNVENCKVLTTLNIGSVPEVNIINCPTLTDLTISEAEDITILNCPKLSELTLPSGVKRVEIRSAAIENLVIPEGIEEVILCCENLKSITLPSSVKRYNLSGCTDLTDVILSYGIKAIPASAFRDCTSLQNITVPDSVAAISVTDYNDESVFVENPGPYIVSDGNFTWTYSGSYGSFADCTSLEEINLPDSIEYIGDWAFSKSGLKKVPNLKNVTEMGYGIFENCQNLTEITLNSKILGRGMFYNCPNLKTATLPEGIEIITDGSFEWSGLEKINIPSTIKEIEAGAFFSTKLESIQIPKSVTFIGDHALYSDSLKDIYYEGSKAEWSAISRHYAAYKFSTTIHYNSSSDCSCGCHKSGIAGFFFKLINFFQKLFGKNKVCACGAKH